MIGNDIVDLKLAQTQSNWRRKGFLAKICTKQEQDLIEKSKNPLELVWLLWSMKESAYKCYIQKNPRRFYAPRKISCDQISDARGSVVINKERYFTKSIITDDVIVTTAGQTPDFIVEENHFSLDGTISFKKQSQVVRAQLKNVISRVLNIPRDSLRIIKDSSGVPRIYENQNQLEVSFSMSHHGKYGAYSILKPKV